jgi:hypothetical protein
LYNQLSQPSQFVAIVLLGWLNFWVFLPTSHQQENPMNTLFLTTESLSPTAGLPTPAPTPEPNGIPRGDREPIRHLLIGSPEIVRLTIHQLHNLRYAEAGLWSPAIALSGDQLTLTLNPNEVMRVLVRYGRSQG